MSRRAIRAYHPKRTGVPNEQLKNRVAMAMSGKSDDAAKEPAPKSEQEVAALTHAVVQATDPRNRLSHKRKSAAEVVSESETRQNATREKRAEALVRAIEVRREAAAARAAAAESGEPVARRRPGRPKIVQAEPEAEPKPKRGPGRPRKVAAEPSAEPKQRKKPGPKPKGAPRPQAKPKYAPDDPMSWLDELPARDRLVNAARELSCEMPLADVTIYGIIDRARVSHKTFYVKFPDRQTLLVEMFTDDLAKGSWFNCKQGWLEGCRDLLGRLEANRQFYQNAFFVREFTEGLIRRVTIASMMHVEDRLAGGAADPAAVEHFARFMAAAVVGDAAMWIANSEGTPAEELAARQTVFFERGLSGILATGEAAAMG